MTPELIKFNQIIIDFIEAVKAFPVDKKSEIIFDKWSLSEILAHLSGWNLQTILVLQNLKKNKLSAWGLSVKNMNLKSVNDRANLSWGEIYKEFIESSKNLVFEYSTLSLELWSKNMFITKKYTPFRFLQIDTNHYQEHLEFLLSKSGLRRLK